MLLEINSKIGSWTILEKTKSIRYNTRWLCLCDCGNKKEVYEYSLKNGSSTNCGCKFKYAGKRENIQERRKEIRKLLKKGYTQRDILSNIYTSTLTIQQELKKLKK